MLSQQTYYIGAMIFAPFRFNQDLLEYPRGEFLSFLVCFFLKKTFLLAFIV